ncbi:MAG: TIGR02757 family protein [Ignavibacteria bacterium]|nr:TIGR02757 family protein [Ignavibacteria bacterium]
MKLKKLLEYHYKQFDRTKIAPDPLQFPHLYKIPADIEIAAFISSIFAYGNVTQINKTLSKIFERIGESPYEFLTSSNSTQIEKEFSGLKHRFYTEIDIIIFFTFLNKILRKESIKNIFYRGVNYDERNLKNAISSFSNYCLNEMGDLCNQRLTHGMKFMFPLPEKGSACKRMNLFLRWMVRKDELDFGLWNEIPTSMLIIPVDTHITQIAKKLKLTKMKITNWRMAEDITEKLKKFDKNDPVKYDFALCHIGIRKLSFNNVNKN